MSNITQRDSFWNKVFELAKADRNIILVSEDMGAPSLDQFRTDLSAQFVNMGIAEQNGHLVASGMSMEGKHPFIYAIAPFVTLRCLEQIRVASAIMDISVTIVGVGAGFGYEDSGPTHHLTEDIAIMRSMPNITINSITDSVMAAAVAEQSVKMESTNYVRLDRKIAPDVYKPGQDFSRGYEVLREGKDAMILSTGYMIHTALKVSDAMKAAGKDVGIIDVYRIPTDEEGLAKEMKKAKKLITMEEHFLPGGFGGYCLEILNDNELSIPVKRIGLPLGKGYCYHYGGREKIHGFYGVDAKSATKDVAAFLG